MSSKNKIKLSANENCYGCSSMALDAMENKLHEAPLYPEVNPIALREKLAEKHQVNFENIALGAGSVQIIDGLIRIFVGADEEVITFEKSFIAYGMLSEFHQRKCNFAPLTNLHCDPESLLALIRPQTKLIFIANPNNPTGTIISHAQLENLLHKINPNIIVAIDEAYSEYVTDTAFPDSLKLQKQFPNLVILHSFSKIYGLAGLRIGYGIMTEPLASKMNAVQIPFFLNHLASAAAIAALQDIEFVEKSSRLNATQRQYLFDELTKLGYQTISSQSNFIYVFFNSDKQKNDFYFALYAHGIITCDMKVFGQDKSLRITIGDEETNKRIISILSIG